MHRQQKITSLFGKTQVNHHAHEVDERMKELIEDNAKLKKLLMEKETYVFQLQRNLLPQPRLFQARHQAAINNEISTTGEIMMRSKLSRQRERLESYLRLFGMHVKLYTDERCTVMYNVPIKGKVVAQYAIQFAKPAESSDWSVLKYHMPLGLRLDIIPSQYHPMSVEYLRMLQVALVAYHDREAQIAKLKEDIPSHVFVSHNMSSMDVEIIFPMIERNGIQEPIKTALQLKYEAFQNRPKEVKIVQNLVTKFSEDFEAALSNQFKMMKYLNLSEGFAGAVSKDGDNVYYCPTEEEQEVINEREGDEQFITRIQQRNDEIERRLNSVDSDEEAVVLATAKKLHKKKESGKQKKQQQQQKQYEDIDDIGSVSDDESVSFTTLRRLMKENKQKNEVTSTFKKPSAPKTATKRSAKHNIEQLEDDLSSMSSEVLKDTNRRQMDNDDASSRVSSYVVTDNDLTTGSYVFIPESKKKQSKSSTAKKGKNNTSIGKENNKKSTKIGSGKSKSKK